MISHRVQVSGRRYDLTPDRQLSIKMRNIESTLAYFHLKAYDVQVRVTMIFRENPTLRDEMPFQAVLSTSVDESWTRKSMACLHLLHFKL